MRATEASGTRLADAGDRRRYVVSLTPAGRKLIGLDRRTRECWLVSAALLVLSEEEERIFLNSGRLTERLARLDN
jgi:DNA-binding MarR family transcriptional regulator